MATRTVTGTIKRYPGVDITFKLTTLFARSDGTYPPYSVVVPTDGTTGAFSVALDVPSSGAAAYTVTLPVGAGAGEKYPFSLAAGSSVALETLLAASSTTLAVDAVQALIEGLAADLALRVPLAGFFWTDDYAEYFAAPEAMTMSAGVERGTGTLTYDTALSASPTVFTSTSLPVALAQGDVLRVTATGVSGYKALTLRRSA